MIAFAIALLLIWLVKKELIWQRAGRVALSTMLLFTALGQVSTIFYLIPRTSILGAVLLTAYFGGAIATHFRLDNPLFSHTLFPVYLALLAWGGLWLRNVLLRTLLPWQRATNT